MDFGLSAEEQSFREEVRSWMHEHLTGESGSARRPRWASATSTPSSPSAWPGSASWPPAVGPAWLAHRARWPRPTAAPEVIFHEEYSRAGGPGRAGLIGEGLLGPTLIHFGSADQQQRFLPGIVDGTQYSVPGLLRAQRRQRPGQRHHQGSPRWGPVGARRPEGVDVAGPVVGLVLRSWARTEPDSVRHHGLSYLLVPMDTDGIETRPIRQITGTAEFNEVFFDGARTDADLAVGEPGEGWKVAMGTLAFSSGALHAGPAGCFEREFHEICADARRTGRWDDPFLRQQLASLWVRLRIMRWNSVRSLGVAESGELMPEAMIHKLYWAGLHRDMGEAAMDALGPEATLTPYGRADNTHDADEMEAAHRLFFFTRSDTIYGGSNQIQRNDRRAGRSASPGNPAPRPGSGPAPIFAPPNDRQHLPPTNDR